MTKEKFINIAENIASMYDNGTSCGAQMSRDEIRKLCNRFFESNVCIPKGENRHDSADVWHQAIEGVPCKIWSPYDNDFVDLNIYHKHPRVIQSEPIYEWRYQIDTSGVCVWTACWYTDEEAIKEIKAKFPYCEKMEETKQERK